MPTYRPFTRVADLPANSQGDRTILEEHLDTNHGTLTDVLERIGQALFTAGGVVVAGTVNNPSGAQVRVQGRLGVSADCRTFLAVADQTVDLADVDTDVKCLVVIRAEAGAFASSSFTDATTGESINHPLMTAWGRLAVLEGDDSDYPELPDDCVPVAEVTKTGASTLTIDTTVTTGPTPRYAGGGGGGSEQSFVIACSDETTDLTTGTAKATFRLPYAFTLTGVRASVTTAPTGQALVVDVNEGGSTILSTKLSIDASEKTSATAATPVVISDSSLADDAEITVDIDQVGSSVAGAGLKVTLIGTKT